MFNPSNDDAATGNLLRSITDGPAGEPVAVQECRSFLSMAITIAKRTSLTAVMSLLAISSFGQDRSVWRTSTDVREGSTGSLIGTVSSLSEGSNRLSVRPDDVASSDVTVSVDSLGTQFFGFGGAINGQPEIFIGSRGFSNLRTGDRLEIRGTGRGTGTIIADSISLLGRPVPAGTTGVGDTRPLGSISTPTASGTTSNAAGSSSRIEATVRQVNGDDDRVVVETDRREMITLRGSASTPVYYRGKTYRFRDLEQGDRIRIDADTSGGTTGEIRARSIEVVQSAQDQSGSARNSGGSTATTISGRVTQIDKARDIVRIDNGRGEVRVDLRAANDESGRRVRAAGLQTNDRVDITGSYSGNSDVFIATTVRFVDDPGSGGSGARSATRTPGLEPAYVTVYGTITQSLRNAPQLTVRDTQNSRSFNVWVLDDFVVRTKSGSYTTADHLNENENVVMKLYRDADGNYIAQTIKVR